MAYKLLAVGCVILERPLIFIEKFNLFGAIIPFYRQFQHQCYNVHCPRSTRAKNIFNQIDFLFVLPVQPPATTGSAMQSNTI